ncbi:MAG: glycoside hydrolase/phage tail family protein [Marinibacterium sp.]|nr:glycoside hydrolase/phage tail family protein [Marinibacterium sp.]
MATILLSAAGAAIGGSIGGSFAGLGSAIIGRAVGATLGRVIDQRIMGTGAEPVEHGKTDRFRLSSAADGQPVAQVYGRMRLGGQVIWASDFLESSATTGGGGGGKGAPRGPQVTQYSYSVSLALALCAGEISAVGRVWADGEEIARDDLNLRVYTGSDDQLPDPLMEAIEGAGQVPAYRGTAYVVIEDMNLDAFGNRVPQLSFEVVRGEQPDSARYAEDPAQALRGVALVPGTGEYSLATTPVYYSAGPGQSRAANVNSASGKPDLVTSLEALTEEAPNCRSVSLIASWFGSDLRCGVCDLRPMVEQAEADGTMPWSVAGLTRGTAQPIALAEGRPIYGGTPSDASVVEAIRHMNEQGLGVMFYPFILMDQQAGNGQPDPWTGAADQPALPWRGRITLSTAPGRAGTPDGTAAAEAEVAAFFGTASALDFSVGNGTVTYTGVPEDWGLRRFILHYAALCAAAGGVEAFCIALEMRALTQIRGAGGSFPAVAQMRTLAAEVRALLGPETQIGYAADWSEYFGYQPQDGSGDRYFHLDPLWADDNIDFVGIDNYMPLSDWRDDAGHKDAGAGSVYDLDYLRGNIEGGEGYDWYYHSDEARAAQIRTPITDGDGEPWVWRYKDIRNWWDNDHHDRVGGVRQAASPWVPRSKPIWFTELGCAAIDKGTNQPNKFLDPKSSESALPHFSTGARDDLIQHQYLRAMLGYWADAANNPVSELYEGPMIDMDHAYVWAWDARPFPAFPNAVETWSDGENYLRGHWLNGRIGGRTLASVTEEICRASDLSAVETGTLHGFVRGYALEDVGAARAALQPLMLRYGFDAVERDGVLQFLPRDGRADHVLDDGSLAETSEFDGLTERTRAGEVEMTGRIRLRFPQADGAHAVVAEEAVRPEDTTHAVATSDLALSMTRGEGRAVAERWLAEARVSRDTLRLALPPSHLSVRAGDVVHLAEQGGGLHPWRVDRVEVSDRQLIEAVRIEPELYRPGDIRDDLVANTGFVPPLPVTPLFMDLPLIAGDEVEHAPHLAVTADPWSGSAAVYHSASDSDFALDRILATRAVAGRTLAPLTRHEPGRWDRGAPLEVELISGAFESRSAQAVLNGANLAAIGDGSSGTWELFQFQTADLVGPRRWWLSDRLRGQLGSDGLMPDIWPEGSWVVLLNGAPEQIDLRPNQLRVAQTYRIGPARRPYTDPSYVDRVEAFEGNGLRPYAPTHLSAQGQAGGDLTLSWIRRTRIDGDSWDLPDVPLGEESERYLLRIRRGGTVLREAEIGLPGWTYSTAAQGADGVLPGDSWEVAQVSARYGPGLFARAPLPL